MNRTFAFLCLLTLPGHTFLFAEAPLDKLRALRIEHAVQVDVQRAPRGESIVVKLLLQPSKGSNINVEVWLPDTAKWNGRFLGLGNGGAAGKINSGSLAGYSAAGYAVATTDMGTAPNADSGIGNREVWKDFGYRATHLMTVVGKQFVQAHYGKGPD